MGLADIVSNGKKAVLAGVGAVIERVSEWQKNASKKKWYPVESHTTVIVKEFCNNKVVFDQ